MIKLYVKFACVLVFSVSIFAEKADFSNEEFEKESQKYRQAELQLVEARSDLSALQEQCLNDKEILSGLAFLYYRHSSYLQDGLECNPADPLNLALKIDSNDKPSLFLSTLLDVEGYRFLRISDLESGIIRKIQNATQRNSKTLIEQNSSLSKYFKEELEKEKTKQRKSYARYKIQDPNQAISKVKSILDQEAQDLLKSINKVQSVDDNAVYHYLKASVHLMLDDIKIAIEELEIGTQKQMTTYLNVQNERIQKTLDAIGYPESMQFYILDRQRPLESYFYSRLWKNGLKDYTAELEKRGNYSEAKKVYHLLKIVSEQCQPEPSNFNWHQSKAISS